MRPNTPGSTPEAASAVFASLGDAVRLRLVARLGQEGPLSITQLTQGAEITRQGITKHLKVLADAGLIQARKQGREQRWTLNPAQLAAARDYLEMVGAGWELALNRLKMAVEAEGEV